MRVSRDKAGPVKRVSIAYGKFSEENNSFLKIFFQKKNETVNQIKYDTKVSGTFLKILKFVKGNKNNL